MKNKLFIFIAVLLFSGFALAQRPPHGGGRPPQGPPNGQQPFPQGQPPFGRDDDRRDGDHRGKGQQPEWVKIVDVNDNKKIEREEYQNAADAYFKKQDKNNNGILEKDEHPQMSPNGFPRDEVPPFFFLRKDQFNLSKADFDTAIRVKFNSLDRNNDGVIDREELKESEPRKHQEDGFRMQPPNARFIGAEMRFGDKLVKDAPFSAETIFENTRRLFDGSTVSKQNKGAFFRDSLGRTRREQPLDFIGTFSVVGENKQPQTLIFISDFVEGNQYFVDVSQKLARKNRIEQNRPPMQENEPKNGKSESLGTKILEGVQVEGTRITIEIPVGELGNDKPILIVTEKWFSPELQMVVMSKHTDPLSGEQIFRLVNIKKGEPAADLFVVPKDYKIENPPKRDGRQK